MGPTGGGGGWVVPRGGSRLFGGGLQNFSWTNFRDFKYIIGFSLAQTQSIGTLFEQIVYKGGAVDMSTSQRHTRSGAGSGVSHANEAAINPKLTGLCQLEIVSGILKK